MNLNRRDFLRQLGFGAAGLAVAATLPETGWALPTKTGKLARSLPEAQGVAPGGLLDFVNTIETNKLNVHSMMVLKRGHVVAEGWWAPYAPQLKHTLYSLSKSFTSSAIGMAVAEKRLTVEDKVVSFFPKELPATVSENLAAMRVKDLLTMSTGHDKDSTPALREGGNTNWIKAFLAQPVEHKPGTFFVYNSGATYMLSAIVQKLTGQPVVEYLKPRLFGPLGIEGEDWEVDPNGINTGGWGLRLRTEDIAKFGQLYLQKGVWNGKRLISEAWIADATSKEVQSKGGKGDASVNDWIQGYGYQFWRCRHDAYRGDGAFGQYCIVLPKEDAVIAITSETGDMQGILNAVWDHILPALQGTGLPAEKIKQAALTQRLGALTLPPAASQASSSVASQISGKTFVVADNASHVKNVSLTFGKDGCIFKLNDEQGDHQVLCGMGRWRDGTTTFSVAPLSLTPTVVPGGNVRKVAGSGGWQDDTTFAMLWRFTETAHYDKVTCRFGKEGVQVEFQSSLSILNKTKDKRPVLDGKVVA
ncbi:serine hydrolase domain-containing protein [Spirosoma fluviale]|uniref:Tat (Twin-arginine translocation) pathway signal sequence n=1 Tax=Spirosoma fluviale TaxID=1597977 RepID=A0A286FHH9_9BACT|nr:serine hydrolase [Spirosoma fluviale]SOD82707.1 Tat (twin-arginine translocation) pathway signal sequence [Spirosoma fluviale]